MSLMDQLLQLSGQAFRYGSPDKVWDVGPQVWRGFLEAASEEQLSIELYASFPHGRARIRLRKDLGDREVKVTDPRSVTSKRASPTFKDIGESCALD